MSKKKLLVLSIFLIIFLFVGCDTNKSEKQNDKKAVTEASNQKQKTKKEAEKKQFVFHENKTINKLINDFNKKSKIKISKEQVSQEFDYQTFINTNDDVSIRISHNSSNNKLFIDFSQESKSINQITYYFKTFLSCISTELTNAEFDKIINELKSGKYESYDQYKYKNLGSTLSRTKLDNGDIRFELKTEIDM